MCEDGGVNYPAGVIILQYVCVPNHHVLYLKLFHCYMSIIFHKVGGAGSVLGQNETKLHISNRHISQNSPNIWKLNDPLI